MNKIDPLGLFNIQGSYGGTIGIIDVSGQGSTTTISLVTPQLGVGGNINISTGLPSMPNAPVFIVGGDYFGFSIASDLSFVSANLGLSKGLWPINASVPLYTINWEDFWNHVLSPNQDKGVPCR